MMNPARLIIQMNRHNWETQRLTAMPNIKRCQRLRHAVAVSSFFQLILNQIFLKLLMYIRQIRLL